MRELNDPLSFALSFYDRNWPIDKAKKVCIKLAVDHKQLNNQKEFDFYSQTFEFLELMTPGSAT